jgi:Glycosyltransferase
MRILLVVANFIPEIGSAAHIYFDLAKAFVKRDHEVDVITSYPRAFYLDKKDLNNDFPVEETVEGIKIHRCKYIIAKRDNIHLRGLEHFLLPRCYFKLYKKIKKKPDVCLIYVPPLPLYYFARKIKKFDNTPSILNYQDFHPQELIDVGLLKNRLMIKLMEHIEKESYRNADYITVLCETGKEFIVERGGNPDRVTHIFNGVNLTDFDLYMAKKDFKSKENIEDNILVSYAGILSPFQGLDDLLDAAKKLRKYDDMVFYIVGDGMIKDHLDYRVNTENMRNVKIMPLQSRDEYFNIINSSDISIVSLDKRMTAPAMPGKLINLLAVKQPIIANVPAFNGTAHVVEKAQCGVVTEPGNINQLANAIITLKDNPELRAEAGLRGRRFLEEEMNLEKSAVLYEQIFKSALNVH